MRLRNFALLILLSSILFSCTLIKERREKKRLANIEYERVYDIEDAILVWDTESPNALEHIYLPATPVTSKNIIWYHPNPWWRIETTPFPVSKDSVKIRRFAPQYGFSQYIDPLTNQSDKITWNTWVSMNHWDSYNNSVTHIWQNFISTYKSTFEKHPEYLAEIKGERVGYGKSNKLCVTNPNVQKLFIEYTLNRIKNNPNQDIISIEPSDGDNHCDCSKCSALGSISNRVFYFANIIAKEVKKIYPKKQLGILAYNKHADIPTFKLEDNIKVLVAPNGFQTLYHPFSLLNIWSQHHKNLGLREYLAIPQWKGEQIRTDKDFFVNEYNLIKKYNYDMLVYETGTNINTILIATLLSKMIMNPSLTWDEVFEKFLNDCFKNSKEPIRRMLERWYTIDKYTKEDVPYSLYDLQEAFSLTKDVNEKARIRDLFAYLHYNILYLDYTADRNKTNTYNFFEYLYHSHNRNIVNVNAITRMNEKNFKNIEGVLDKFKYKDPSKMTWIKWIDDKQLDQLFQNDLKKYPPKKYEHITYNILERQFSESKIKHLNTYNQTVTARGEFQIYAHSQNLVITPIYKTENATSITIMDLNGDFIQEKILNSNEKWQIKLPKIGFYTISQHRKHSATIRLDGDFNLIFKDTSPKLYGKGVKADIIKTSKNEQNRIYIVQPTN